MSTESSFSTNFAGHACYFTSERVELIDHRVDGVFEQENFAAHVYRNLLGKVAAGDGSRDLGDVAYLSGQVSCHKVDVVGKVLPCSRDSGHLGLAAQFTVGSNFARYASDLSSEGAELIHHGIERVFEFEDLAADVDGDFA